MGVPNSNGPGNRLLDVKQVAAKIARSTRWVWRAVAGKEFPAPVKLGNRGARWVEAEVDQWIDGLREQRDRRAA